MSKVKMEPMILVDDVEASSEWYQSVFGLRSDHGGKEFERLVDAEGGVVLLLLRRATAPRQTDKSAVRLYFVVESAVDVLAGIPLEKGLQKGSEPVWSDIAHQWEVRVRDPDGYEVVICSREGRN